MDIRRIEIVGPEGPCGLSYTEWGDPAAARRVVCVHGLTRNARDFDSLARDLAADARVLCIDMPGRGGSDWFRDPEHYRVPVYAALVHALIEELHLAPLDWIGTSMGGLIGMHVAASRDAPTARLVVNDIGPLVPQAAVQMIRDYVGLELFFGSQDELEAHLRLIHAPFGPLSDAEWRHLAAHSSRRRDDGRWVLSYDPEIRVPFAADAERDIDYWQVYDAISCPVLVLRGTESALLPRAVAEAMRDRGPRAEVVEFEGIGHAPALMARDQIRVIRRWLQL